MKRVQIIGRGGSGKTTLAKQLSKILDIPHYEPDAIFWLPDWKMKDKQQFKKEVGEILNKDSWIFCGGYFTPLDGAICKRADTIIVLNLPYRITFWRLLKRSLKRGITKEKLWGTNTESLLVTLFNPKRSILWLDLKGYIKRGRNSYRAKVVKYGQQDKIIEFTSPKHLQKWLNQINNANLKTRSQK